MSQPDSAAAASKRAKEAAAAERLKKKVERMSTMAAAFGPKVIERIATTKLRNHLSAFANAPRLGPNTKRILAVGMFVEEQRRLLAATRHAVTRHGGGQAAAKTGVLVTVDDADATAEALHYPVPVRMGKGMRYQCPETVALHQAASAKRKRAEDQPVDSRKRARKITDTQSDAPEEEDQAEDEEADSDESDE